MKSGVRFLMCLGLVLLTSGLFPSNMLHRNAFVGPSVWDWNLGVYKNFQITERVQLQLRGEFYNVLNHKNFYVLGFGQGGADVSSLGSCDAAAIAAKQCGSNQQGMSLVTAKKGGYGNPFDDHRNTQLAIRINF